MPDVCNTVEAGEIPFSAMEVAAFADGDNAGANAMIAASIIVRRRLYPLLRNSPDAHLMGAGLLKGGTWVRRVLDCKLYLVLAAIYQYRDDTPVPFVGGMTHVVIAPNLGGVSSPNPECSRRMNNAAASIEVD